MGRFDSLFRLLTLWQLITLAIATVVSAGIAYAVYMNLGGAADSALPQTEQLYPVQYGDLTNKVSTNGNLLFPNKEILTFGTQGTVSEVFVKEGDKVTMAQTLATLGDADIALLENAVSQAKVKLRDAQDDLEVIESPNNALEIAQAYAKVSTSRVLVRTAQDTLEAESVISDEDIKVATKEVEASRIKWLNAIADLEIARKEWVKEVEDVTESVDSGEDGYQTVFSKWLGVDINEEERLKAPKTLFKEWGADLGFLFKAEKRYTDLGTWVLVQTLPMDDRETRWNEVTVYSWLDFPPSQISPTCKEDPTLLLGDCVEQEMSTAWEIYDTARDNLAVAENSASKEIIKAEDSIDQSLNTFEDARIVLEDLQAGPDLLEVDAKEKQLKVEKESLAKAEVDLTQLLSAPALLDVELAKKNLRSAQVALESAAANLDAAVLESPISGIVTFVGVSEGENVNPNTPIVEIADPLKVEVDGIVDEIDVLFVKVGALATVSMDALPNETLDGTVSFVSSIARNQSGVVTYPIRIELDEAPAIQFKEGLSATAAIIIREENNVLLIPTQALYGSFDRATVKVWTEGIIEERAVVLGNNDDFWIVVHEGLVQGERIVMESEEVTATSQFNFRGFGSGRNQGGPGGGRG